MGFRIDGLNPALLAFTDHELPAMRGGVTVKLTVGQIIDILAAILDPNGHHADAFARGNHTGTQAIATVGGLQAALDAKLALAGGPMSGDIDLTGHALNNAGDGVGDYLKGLITTRASTTQVSVAAGQIKGNGRFVKNAGALAKNINAAWAAGNNVGGMESGFTVAANLTYHLHALRKISDGSFEWIYSPNTTVATIPTGYEWVARFWSVYTNASSQIFDYTQVDNTCLMAQVLWFSTTSALAFGLGTIPVTVPLPGGIRTKALLSLSVQVNTATCVLTVTDADDATGNSCSGVACQASNTGAASNAASRGLAKTNTARALGRAVAGTSSGAAVNIGGWEDYTLPRVA